LKNKIKFKKGLVMTSWEYFIFFLFSDDEIDLFPEEGTQIQTGFCI